MICLVEAKSQEHSSELENSRLDTMKVESLTELSRAAWTENPTMGVKYAELAVERSGDSLQIAKSISNLSAAHRFAGNQVVSLKYALQALDYFERHNILKDIASAAHNVASAYDDLANYPLALEYYLRSLKIKEQLADTTMILTALNNIGVMYDNQDDFENALRYYNKMLELALASDKDMYKAAAYTNTGITYTVMERSQEALVQFQLALDLYKKMGGNKFNLVLIYSQSGVAYDALGQYAKADSLHKLAEGLAGEVGTPDLRQETLFNRGVGLMKRKSFGQAEKLLVEGMNVSIAHDDVYYLRVFYDVLADLYEAKKDYGKALAYEKLIREYEDSIKSEVNLRNMNELQTLYETDKKELELVEQKQRNEIQRAEIARQEERYFLLIIIIGLAGAFVVWLILTNRKKTLINHTLRDQKSKIETLAQKQARLSEELLDQKNRELVTYNVQMSQQNEILKNLKEELQGTKHPDAPRLVRSINVNLKQQNQWEEFKIHFEKVHPGFFSFLGNRFPQLTPHDLRLCAYIKMRLESAAIMRILNISNKGLETARYRIKRKLNLGPSDDLNDFISTTT